MLFIVPDEPDETLDAPTGGGATLDPGSARKAQLDEAETTKGTQKVDLDLDDAPFLEEEEEEEELLEEEEQFELPGADKPPKEKKELPAILRNKFLYMGIAAVLLLGLAAFFLLGGEDAPPPPPVAEQPTPEPEPEPTVEQAPQPEPEPEVPGEMLVRLDPFIIEQRDQQGELRFLEISLVFSTTNPDLADNLTRETPTVRYALFYYLRSKDLAFLTDQENVDNLKKELLSVANQYMVNGQFETLLFDQYLVK